MNSTAGFAEDWEGNSLAMRYDETMSAAQQRHRDDIRRVERERKEVTEQQKQDLQTLRSDLQSSKDKLEQSKTRNTVLTNELKTLREQLKTSLDKSKHDDELIEVLLKQQQQMKTTHDQQQKDIDMKSKFSAELEQTYKLDQMKQSNLVKQLQLIVDQKETKIRELEMHLDENRIEVSIHPRFISNVNYSFQYERDDPHDISHGRRFSFHDQHHQSTCTNAKRDSGTDAIGDVETNIIHDWSCSFAFGEERLCHFIE